VRANFLSRGLGPKIAAVTGGGIGMEMGREEGLWGRGRRVPASDPSVPIEVLG